MERPKMIIKEPIYGNEVSFEFDEKWCDCQAWWKQKPHLICTAHLHEGRVFSCNFSRPEDENLIHCSDYQLQKKDQK
jgi:hypothetical protein